MKRVLSVVGAMMVSMILVRPLAAADSDLMEGSAAAWREFNDQRATHHPWNSSMALPTSLKEAGLEETFSFCPTMPSWRDGGSTGGWVKDTNGNYFAFAIAAALPATEGFQFNPRPMFYVGAAWWQDPLAVPVPFDSPCEQFLIGLLGKHWAQLEAGYYETLERALADLRRWRSELDDDISRLEAALATHRPTKEDPVEVKTGATP